MQYHFLLRASSLYSTSFCIQSGHIQPTLWIAYLFFRAKAISIASRYLSFLSRMLQTLSDLILLRADTAESIFYFWNSNQPRYYRIKSLRMSLMSSSDGTYPPSLTFLSMSISWFLVQDLATALRPGKNFFSSSTRGSNLFKKSSLQLESSSYAGIQLSMTRSSPSMPRFCNSLVCRQQFFSYYSILCYFKQLTQCLETLGLSCRMLIHRWLSIHLASISSFTTRQMRKERVVCQAQLTSFSATLLSVLATSMSRQTMMRLSGFSSSSIRLSARPSLPRSRQYLAMSVKTLVFFCFLGRESNFCLISSKAMASLFFSILHLAQCRKIRYLESESPKIMSAMKCILDLSRMVRNRSLSSFFRCWNSLTVSVLFRNQNLRLLMILISPHSSSMSIAELYRFLTKQVNLSILTWSTGSIQYLTAEISGFSTQSSAFSTSSLTSGVFSRLILISYSPSLTTLTLLIFHNSPSTLRSTTSPSKQHIYCRCSPMICRYRSQYSPSRILSISITVWYRCGTTRTISWQSQVQMCRQSDSRASSWLQLERGDSRVDQPLQRSSSFGLEKIKMGGWAGSRGSGTGASQLRKYLVGLQTFLEGQRQLRPGTVADYRPYLSSIIASSLLCSLVAVSMQSIKDGLQKIRPNFLACLLQENASKFSQLSFKYESLQNTAFFFVVKLYNSSVLSLDRQAISSASPCTAPKTGFSTRILSSGTGCHFSRKLSASPSCFYFSSTSVLLGSSSQPRYLSTFLSGVEQRGELQLPWCTWPLKGSISQQSPEASTTSSSSILVKPMNITLSLALQGTVFLSSPLQLKMMIALRKLDGMTN